MECRTSGHQLALDKPATPFGSSLQTRPSLSNFENYTEADAPQLTYGYPIMTMAAMYPPLFRRIMNPRVRKWREMYYPEITDWSAYNAATNPMPR